MQEHPIPFSGPMVKAILDGRKSQTRRIAKLQPDAEHDGEPYWNVGGYRAWRFRGVDDVLRMGTHNPLLCPYGEVGDHSWVREAWRTGSSLDKLSGSQIAAKAIAAGYSPGCPIWYEADGCFRAWGCNDAVDFGGKGRYRHGRFMPRWASRITPEIEHVRVQRLQEITEEDAKAEGIYGLWHDAVGPMPGGFVYYWDGADGVRRGGFETARRCYECLWDEINHERATWLSNPWVWAISFARVTL